MITHVQLDLLPEDLQQKVLAKYRVALMDPAHRMTQLECAWLYGYQYNSIRSHVCNGKIKATGTQQSRRISHAAMRKFLRERGTGGRKRKSMIEAQLRTV